MGGGLGALLFLIIVPAHFNNLIIIDRRIIHLKLGGNRIPIIVKISVKFHPKVCRINVTGPSGGGCLSSGP